MHGLSFRLLTRRGLGLSCSLRGLRLFSLGGPWLPQVLVEAFHLNEFVSVYGRSLTFRRRERDFSALGQVVSLQNGVPLLGDDLRFDLSLRSLGLREHLLEDLLLIGRAFAEALDQ